MRLKDSTVKIAGCRPELIFALTIADSVYKSYGYDMVITSLQDGNHSTTSLHYAGSAADLRIRNVQEVDLTDIVLEIKNRLGIDFDVILEKDHIHLEFQPRK